MTPLKKSLHRRMKVMRTGVKTYTSQPHSAEPQESTMSPQWMVYLSIWQTLITYPSRSDMQSHHLADTGVTTSHAATWYSPALMMKVLRDPVNDAAHLPVPIPEVQPPGKQMFHLQYTITCVTTSHPPQNHS